MLHLLALLAGCSVVWGNFSQLEQVMRALEEQGRLSEVSPDLLARIRAATGRDVVEVEQRPLTSRALERRQNLFGAGRGGRRQRGECRALERENRELREELAAARVQLSSAAPPCPVQSRPAPHCPAELPEPEIHQPQPEPVIYLPQPDPTPARPREQRGPAGELLSSFLVTPPVQTSTVFSALTTTTVTTVTSIQEVGVFFHGRRKVLEVTETAIETRVITTTLSSSIEISPTPTWSVVTVTPSSSSVLPSASPPQPNLLFQRTAEHEKLALLARLSSLTGGQATPALPDLPAVQAEVVEISPPAPAFLSLQDYLGTVEGASAAELPVAAPLVALRPTVSTVFLSGSVPGEYSTSLVTLEPSRARRAALPPVTNSRADDGLPSISETKPENTSN